MISTLTTHGSQTTDSLVRDLTAEFAALPAGTVRRCVADVWVCTQHLGLDVTPDQLERIAREHLVGLIKSEPPSGRLR